MSTSILNISGCGTSLHSSNEHGICACAFTHPSTPQLTQMQQLEMGEEDWEFVLPLVEDRPIIQVISQVTPVSSVTAFMLQCALHAEREHSAWGICQRRNHTAWAPWPWWGWRGVQGRHVISASL